MADERRGSVYGTGICTLQCVPMTRPNPLYSAFVVLGAISFFFSALVAAYFVVRAGIAKLESKIAKRPELARRFRIKS